MGCWLNHWGHVCGLEHMEEILSVLKGCMEKVPNGKVGLDFLSWAVMSAVGWSFLVVEGVALEEGSSVVGPEGWLAGGGRAGSGWLGLAASTASL